MSREADLLAEGEPEKEWNPGVAETLPRKRVSGGALIRDQEGRILFIEPTYKPMLDIPGGIAEFDESPYDACQREVMEEVGLDLTIGPLLVVDWDPARGVWHDALAFVFDGGVLTGNEQLVPQPDEVRAIHFLTLAEAAPRTYPSMVRRLSRALDALESGAPQYSEFGRRR
ncbi:NUDIX hydrolase [Kribbella antibiotica]|uniref:NUDIX hydrolase n=1 Tax=Kribbella antibiotica TaxID=190195 RepID=A0A4R4ZSV8_9ACTN|nr:NUDIX hydrolase [Kribbella antibiotica]TDD62161.1 NUDIX hydrolase [Kribbella antibiotica]